jgi:hypothetical protein
MPRPTVIARSKATRQSRGQCAPGTRLPRRFAPRNDTVGRLAGHFTRSIAGIQRGRCCCLQPLDSRLHRTDRRGPRGTGPSSWLPGAPLFRRSLHLAWGLIATAGDFCGPRAPGCGPRSHQLAQQPRPCQQRRGEAAEGAAFLAPEAVGGVRGAEAREAVGGARPGAAAAMHPATTVRHRRLAAFGACPRVGAAPRRGGGITGRRPILQPVAPLGMGSYRRQRGSSWLTGSSGWFCRHSSTCSRRQNAPDRIAAVPLCPPGQEPGAWVGESRRLVGPCGAAVAIQGGVVRGDDAGGEHGLDHIARLQGLECGARYAAVVVRRPVGGPCAGEDSDQLFEEGEVGRDCHGAGSSGAVAGTRVCTRDMNGT